jgi:hypothetical protein
MEVEGQAAASYVAYASGARRQKLLM